MIMKQIENLESKIGELSYNLDKLRKAVAGLEEAVTAQGSGD